MKLAQISRNQVPEHLRGKWGRPFQFLGRVILGSFGWQVTGNIPNEKRIIFVGAPHTSNWDFIFGIAALFALNLNLKWLGKNSIFVPFLSPIFKWLGGIPVNRENPGLLIDEIVKIIQKEKGLAIGIAPEGSRKKVEKWKSRFLRIADQTKSKILLFSIDAPSKTINIDKFFEPCGNNEEDIKFLMNYYKQFKGINSNQS